MTSVAVAVAVAARLRAAGCVFAEEEAELLLAAARGPGELTDLLERRCSGVPLEHLLGWVAFRGRRIEVDAGVFVPRRRTEYLVELAVSLARPPTVVVDMCCGSGAIGTCVAAELTDAGETGIEVHAVDIDPAAVVCARRNLAACSGRAHVGDLYAPLPPDLRGRIDLLLVNAPYVPTGEIALLPPEAREHEPSMAYDGGVDGLNIHRRVSRDAAAWLAPNGRLLVETSSAQSAASVAILRADGLAAEAATCAELAATVVIGRRA